MYVSNVFLLLVLFAYNYKKVLLALVYPFLFTKGSITMREGKEEKGNEKVIL